MFGQDRNRSGRGPHLGASAGHSDLVHLRSSDVVLAAQTFGLDSPQPAACPPIH